MIRSTQAGEEIYPGSEIEINTRQLISWTKAFPTNIYANWYLKNTDNATILSGSSNIIANPRREAIEIIINERILLPDTIHTGSDLFIIWDIQLGDEIKQISEHFLVSNKELADFGIQDTVTLPGQGMSYEGVVESFSTRPLRIDVYAPDGVTTVGSINPNPSFTSNSLVVDETLPINDIWMLNNGSITTPVVNPIFLSPLTYALPTDPLTPIGYNSSTSWKIEYERTLDPYILNWYFDDNQELIGTSQSWLINNIVASAMHELKTTVERALHYPGLLESSLSNSDYVQFLKMGRDLFNMVERITNFTMMGADGSMRRAWLYCAAYEIAQSRQLEEAIKAFDFSGQSTSLTVDISQAYETLKSDMNEKIETYVKPYKRQLSQKGVLEGDGSTNNSMGSRANIALGLTVSGVGNGGQGGGSFQFRSLI